MLSRVPDIQSKLEAKRLELAAALAHSKPSRVTRLEALLRETRDKRTSQSERVGKLYVTHRETNPGQPPTEEILKADAALKDMDTQVGKLRAQLEKERGIWGPELFRIIRLHTEVAAPAIEQCIGILDAVTALHAEADAYIASGFQSWAVQRTEPLRDVVMRLRRLMKNREAK